jgi:SAM-dependent methyltransferase
LPGVNDRSTDAGARVDGVVFGAAAAAYERFRPGYPGEVADAVMAYAGGALRSALEVGAGTGKATRLFATRGVQVTAVEPDPEMAALLHETTRDLHVEAVVSTFERFDARGRRFDLVFSAAAWHWTDPGTRWGRALGMLEPGGTLALFGIPGELADPDLTQRVQDVEREHLPDTSDDPGAPWSIDQLEQAGGFTAVVQRTLPNRFTCTADDYVGRLATVSSYLALDATARAAALEAVREQLPAHVAVDAGVRLVMARRA